MTSDELLDRSVVTEISEITKDGHEAFASEWGAINVYVLFGRRRGEDVLVLNVVGEKVNNEVEQTCHEIVLRNNVQGNGWCSEKLEGEILYGCFCFTVDQKISVSDTVVDAGKVGGCSMLKRACNNEQHCGVPMAILWGCESINIDA